ncbi:MAG: ResB protein [Actinobacteria bacterium]|nr:ResB protein [Actinomycetota bacterium]
MMAVWRFFTSHKTCAWTGLAFCLAGAAGSVVMGRYPELFSDMDAGILADWFARKGLIAPAPTLWLYGLLLATALMTANAACCTAERLVQIFRGKVTLRRLLPHVMHVAFLGVVLSHLVSSLYGDRIHGVAVPQGGFAHVGSTGWILSLDRFDAVMAPVFHEGYGIYIKNFGATPWGAPFAVFDANRDPGAVAILVSSVLFTVANLIYLLPARREDA